MPEPTHATAEQASPAAKRRGNPSLHLAPRCGARTRSGCPCQAPAIRGKQRCRMHGGRSTGPRTPEGRQRLREARLSAGAAGAKSRAIRYFRSGLVRSGRMQRAALACHKFLPADLVSRLFSCSAPELGIPVCPDGGLTVAEDRAMRQAHMAALAPWRVAIAEARQAAKAARLARAAARRDASHAAPAPTPPDGSEPALASEHGIRVPEAHAPRAPRTAPPAANGSASGSSRKSVPEPHAPVADGRARPDAATGAVAPCDHPMPEPHAPEAARPAGSDPVAAAGASHEVAAPKPQAPEAVCPMPDAPIMAASATRVIPKPIPPAPAASAAPAIADRAATDTPARISVTTAHAPEAPCSRADATPCARADSVPAPQAPETTPTAPPRLSRAARRRWKWQQRQLRKHAAAGHGLPSAPHGMAGPAAGALASPLRPR